MINPQRKSEGIIRKLRKLSLSTLCNLKDHVCLCLKMSDGDLTHSLLGYYEPGHDIGKGKKKQLIDNDDLQEHEKNCIKDRKRFCFGAMILLFKQLAISVE